MALHRLPAGERRHVGVGRQQEHGHRRALEPDGLHHVVGKDLQVGRPGRIVGARDNGWIVHPASLYFRCNGGFVPRARDADGCPVPHAHVAVEDVLAARGAQGLVERTLHRRVGEIREVLHDEHVVVGLLVGPGDHLVGDLDRNLRGLDAALAIGEELEGAEAVQKRRLEGVADGALVGVVEDGGQLAVEGLGHDHLAVGGARRGLQAVGHARLRVPLADLREDEEAVVLLALDAKALHGELAHAVPERHERAAVAVELEGPLGWCVRRGHVTPP